MALIEVMIRIRNHTGNGSTGAAFAVADAARADAVAANTIISAVMNDCGVYNLVRERLPHRSGVGGQVVAVGFAVNDPFLEARGEFLSEPISDMLQVNDELMQKSSVRISTISSSIAWRTRSIRAKVIARVIIIIIISSHVGMHPRYVDGGRLQVVASFSATGIMPGLAGMMEQRDLLIRRGGEGLILHRQKHDTALVRSIHPPRATAAQPTGGVTCSGFARPGRVLGARVF